MAAQFTQRSLTGPVIAAKKLSHGYHMRRSGSPRHGSYIIMVIGHHHESTVGVHTEVIEDIQKVTLRVKHHPVTRTFHIGKSPVNIIGKCIVDTMVIPLSGKSMQRCEPLTVDIEHGAEVKPVIEEIQPVMSRNKRAEHIATLARSYQSLTHKLTHISVASRTTACGGAGHVADTHLTAPDKHGITLEQKRAYHLAVALKQHSVSIVVHAVEIHVHIFTRVVEALAPYPFDFFFSVHAILTPAAANRFVQKAARSIISGPLYFRLSALMRRAQQVVDCLYGIKCCDRHFHERCVPVAHGTVPEAGKLQSTESAAMA